MPSLRKLRAGRIPGADASTWVGDYGTIFYNEATGTLRISDGATPGGNPLTLVSSDFAFTFGDFVATTPADGSASLSSLQENQDINIYSNGTGKINLIGQLEVFPPDGDIYSREPIFRVSVDGQVRMLVPTTDSNAGAVEIIGSTSSQSISPALAGVMFHVTGQNNTSSSIYNDGIGSNPNYIGRRYNGTAATPTQVLSGQTIVRFSGQGYSTGGFNPPADGTISLDALEDFTQTGQGTIWRIYNNPIGGNVRQEVATVSVADGVSATKFTAQAGTTSIAPITLTAGTNLTTAAAGNIEYDGKILYATTTGTQRGIVAANQWYLLNSDRSINFATTAAQSLFGVSPTLTANTRYYFRLKAVISRTSGDNNTVLTIGWGGAATLSRVAFTCQSKTGSLGTVGTESMVEHTITTNFANGYTLTATSNAPSTHTIILTGVISLGASGGTVIPQITWSGATAAGAVTVQATSNWQLHPISSTGANTSVGNWS